MALIELVDYNTVYGTDTTKTEKKSTRRRGGAKGKAAAPAAKAAPAAATAEVTPADDATVIETPAAKPETPSASAEHEENAEKGE